MRRFLQAPLRSHLNKLRYYPRNLTGQRCSSRLYKPLNPETSQIRLLNVPQGPSSGFELVTASLDDKPRYAALLYLLGNPEHYGQITIEGNTVKIPDNLASAFLCMLSYEPFRSQSDCQYLWADAICINQDDHEERSQQVQLMRRIFQLAHSTLAWAGPKDYSLAFDTIKTIGKIIDQNATNKGIVSTTPFDIEWLRGYPELCLDRGSNLPNNHLIDPWSAVADFLQHQYWKRAWVFQEVVLADQLAFISPGKSNLEWSTRVNLEATDHRDHIYGLLGVSGIPMSPNYSPENRASHVYTKYIAGWLKAARTQKTMHVRTPLAFLSLAGVGKFGESDLPSWVPNYPEKKDVAVPWYYKASDMKILAQEYPRGEDYAILASFMSLASSFTARNSRHVSGILAAQAIIRLLRVNSLQRTTRDLIHTAMNLAMLIAYFNQEPSDTVQNTLGSDWDENILKLAFPAIDVTRLGINPDIFSELSSWDRQRRIDATFAIVTLFHHYQFFETSEGYLGEVDHQVVKGDRLCPRRLQQASHLEA
ncbi:hypothetical protein FGSG_07348 [Fusarium graminearum PH-1]|uniref:Chromosome 4, complete genome n=1 Tax=Gibberella zeae (strain ATCC MYA-4620 / CBS 123657 / FGSC 9075 / NRRL 31084 / PH-1) TaxID=229533 RepID=I1RT51_GIBZE|nr:hypothetical protein FGSG_07348 [Fusarium graminearum PH-1]ESU13600.1 hypothetical protein FGSG_07348 [Fusarium graminearum PH-1]CEF83929.1 unnamed protein product [Fusarium graminearum]|eukprot:XP_011327107.1 hypothetical protein FGSG_07348 [Fusarium graminearum PH-1]